MADLLKILVVDDDALDRMAIKRNLRASGLNAEVEMAETGKEGKEKVLTKAYDFIFIDFRLPDMDGLQLLKQFRENEITIPVLIVTSHGDEQIAAEAFRAGANDYIPKTLLTPEGIAHSIHTAIRLHKMEEEKRKTERALYQTQRQLESIISNSPIVFWCVDEKGIFTLMKGKALDLLNLNADHLIGNSFFDVFKESPDTLKKIKQALRGNSVSSIVNINNYYLNSHFIPLHSESGKITGVTGVAFDITERINVERQLYQAKSIAEKSVQIKEQFLANMSHEIRTPMNGIIGLAKLLNKTPLSVNQQKYLSAIISSAGNLLHIINDILDFSKIEADKVVFEETDFNLHTLVQELLAIFSVKAQEKNIALLLEISQEVPETLQGDPVKLTQILNNLIGNAIKFTDKGHVKLTITSENSGSNSSAVMFKIQDSGIGIPSEKLSSIFESFTQGASDTSRKYGGTGLGLTITRRLIELQGGTISVASQEHTGSTFTFSLTYKKPTQEEKKQPVTVHANAVAIPKNCANLKILLAEDNEINQLLVSQLMADWNFELDIATNGQEALDKLKQKNYDLILMDAQMPVLDGFEAMEQIRKMQGLAEIPIISLTAHATKKEIDRCFAAGANAYLSKPFEAEDLLQKIVELMNCKQQDAGNSDEQENNLLVHTLESKAAYMPEILQMYILSIPDALANLMQLYNTKQYRLLSEASATLKDNIAILELSVLPDILYRLSHVQPFDNAADEYKTLLTEAKKAWHETEAKLLTILQKVTTNTSGCSGQDRHF